MSNKLVVIQDPQYETSEKERLTFECNECGTVYWHDAYKRDDIAIKKCKNCGEITYQTRYFPEPINKKHWITSREKQEWVMNLMRDEV